MNPDLLRLLMALGGVACLVAVPFVPAEHKLEVVGAGAGLLGWAKHAPGHLSVTTHPDSLK